ncbi:MAG TPA: PVC-type heme-binding CxxCH protein [Pirellulales bacterium]|jgi:putative membrane-bound dehydrogenase-like protein|nr:PVC-type heme-binding CxxCH protein [Pirellulales bacterium]
MIRPRFAAIAHGLLVGIALLAAAPISAADPDPPARTLPPGTPAPLDPAAGLASLHVPAGFHVELVAAEPLIMDPVAFDWGPDGKLWVAEMLDYPLGLDNAGKPGGKICFLEDTDGDGRYDRSTEFLTDVAFPTGLMAWRDGVLVTAAGELFFARDTDGDGRADERRVLLAGFHPGNQQHRVNGPRWGMDGWCYLANGDSGGRVESLQTGQTVDISGRDLRFRPDDGALETVTGMTQFGRDRDDWGHWFGSNNSNPGYQFVLEDRYLRRNPHIAPPAPTARVVDPSPLLHPLSVTVERFNTPTAANHYTSACGGTIYRDDLLGADVAGDYFVCEPSHNLVHRETLARTGLVFQGRPADGPDAHFLRSTDNWFRPVMCRTGPDGGLWVADMYRAVLEHPEWIPDDVEARLDLRAGADRGRIYRVVRDGVALRPVPRCTDLTASQLAAALDSPNGTRRDLVQRVIRWRRDPKVAAPLAALARSAARPAVRAQALWTLDGLDRLGEDLLLAGLADRSAGVRAQSLEIAQRHLAEMANTPLKNGTGSEPQPAGPAKNDGREVPVPIFQHTAKLDDALAALAADQDAASQNVDVQLQLAYLLGYSSDPRSAALLGAMLVQHADDPLLTAAAFSSLTRENVATVLRQTRAVNLPDPHVIGQLLVFAAAVGADAALADGLAAAATPRDGKFAPWQFAALTEALVALRHDGKSLAETLAAKTATTGSPSAVSTVPAKLQMINAAARAIAADDALADDRRTAAIGLLGLADDRDADFAVLSALAEPRESAAIQSAAIAALARSGDDRAAAALLTHWDSYSPPLAAAALDVLLSRDAWVATLLDRLADGTVQPNQLDAARRGQLLEHHSEPLRARAATLLAAGNADRQKVIEQLASVLDKPGDAARGRQVFVRRCATCHRLEGQGFSVGADLAAVGNKSPQALLIAILDPNRAIEDRYVNYLAVDDDGRQFAGVLAAETGESLTLRGAEGKEQVLLRKNLDVLRRTGKSLMPEGLERDMTPADLADVIAYVAGTGPRQPLAVVRPAADGALALAAAAARIEGPTVRLEEKYKNLGYWGSADDVASWSIELAAAGSFVVDVDYACDDTSAGNTFRLEVDGQALTGKVAGTGSWDDYRDARIGRVDLSAGTHTLTFRSVDLPAGSFLLDLRAIRLSPVGR